jgi:cytochrome c-type biogenesis protein CcmH
MTMRKAIQGFLLAMVLLAQAPALAVQPDEMLVDPALEQRARTLSRELRCMVCQNQSIDDSEAPLARDLRLLVRERLKTGDSDQQVLDFLVARYGQFVLLKPRFGWDTALLWGAPAGVLVIGVLGLVVLIRRSRDPAQGIADQAPLSEAERNRLNVLLENPRGSPGRSS